MRTGQLKLPTKMVPADRDDGWDPFRLQDFAQRAQGLPES